jgi:hypothetical protein
VDCSLKIDIPVEYGPAEKYQGTLGHKVNHHFEPETRYRQIETARYVYYAQFVDLLQSIINIDSWHKGASKSCNGLGRIQKLEK